MITFRRVEWLLCQQNYCIEVMKKILQLQPWKKTNPDDWEQRNPIWYNLVEKEMYPNSEAPLLVQQQCCAMKVERGQLQSCWAEIWFAKNWEIRLSWARQIQLSIIWALCSSVAWRLPPGEEVGMVALFQLHQKCVLGEFQVNCAMHGAFQIPLQWSPEF